MIIYYNILKAIDNASNKKSDKLNKLDLSIKFINPLLKNYTQKSLIEEENINQHISLLHTLDIEKDIKHELNIILFLIFCEFSYIFI